MAAFPLCLIIHTIINRGYVPSIKGYLHPGELGFKVNDHLVEYFSDVINVKLPPIWKMSWTRLKKGKSSGPRSSMISTPFKGKLDYANETIQKEVILTNEVCLQCGKPMVVKWSRKGKFLSCSGFPECRYAKSITTG